MNQFIQEIQPYIMSIVVAVVGLLTTVVLALLASLKTKVNLWIDTKTSVSQRELLHKVAAEAFAHAETMFMDESGLGTRKLNEALIYASKKLGNIGVKVSTEELKAAIHNACLKHNADKVKVLKDGGSVAS
ncbi:hypothetical protein D3C73_537640 [compost metagenome]